MQKQFLAALAAAVVVFVAGHVYADGFSPTVACDQPNGWELVPIGNSSDLCYVFRAAATLTIPADCLADVLVVGGGGGGGQASGVGGGGGGAGGLIYRQDLLVSARDYAIIVGAGGAANVNGSGSAFGEIEVLGGGRGGTGPMGTPGGAGGSGGGSGNRTVGGSGTPGQGHDGGTANGWSYGGGGGGAGGPGEASISNTRGGNGGDGLVIDITGERITYAAGGGGSFCKTGSDGAAAPNKPGVGGSNGVGGSGAGTDINATAGLDGTGSGGGGTGNSGQIAGKGGDGIVIVRITHVIDFALPVIIDAEVTETTASSVTFGCHIASCGDGTDACAVKAVYGFDADHLVFEASLASDAAVGTPSYTVSGLVPGRDYVMKIVGTNAAGFFETRLFSFSTPEGAYTPTDATLPFVAPDVTGVDQRGGHFSFKGQLAAGGAVDGVTVRVEWGTAPDRLDGVLTAEVNVDGVWLSSAALGKEGDTVYYRVSATAPDGGYDRTQVRSLTLTHETFYDALAYQPGRVASSPYATGGDLIFHCTDANHADYIHVFTNVAAAAKFIPAADLTVCVLVIGGGGAGGSWYGGGGGAGGFAEVLGKALSSGIEYDVTVGAGGARAIAFDKYGGDGGPSAFGDVSVRGGGAGGTYHWNKVGREGASGGGSTTMDGSPYVAGGAGTFGQGFEGADCPNSRDRAGGGGGAGAPGINGGTDDAGYAILSNGGVGKTSDILGYSRYFAGGGGGYNGSGASAGGLGGGGSSVVGKLNGNDAEDGLGGGGGGAGSDKLCGGAGGNGVVIVRYVDPANVHPFLRSFAVVNDGSAAMSVSGVVGGFGAGATGGRVVVEYYLASTPDEVTSVDVFTSDEVSSDTAFAYSISGLDFGTTYGWRATAVNSAGDEVLLGGGSFETCSGFLDATGGTRVRLENTFDYVHTFTEDGTFVTTGRGFVRVLVVGGGGGGGSGGGTGGGGGGAGGYIYDRSFFVEPGTYKVTVGAGGTADHNGGDSSVFGLVAIGGASGGKSMSVPVNGGSGGGSANRTTGGKGVPGQGCHGGAANGWSYGGGGGGAGTPGEASVDSSTTGCGGNGGDGVKNDISGDDVVYAAGGGGAFSKSGNCGSSAPNAPGAGGSNGIGGSGAGTGIAATAGIDGTGSGGGGGISGYASGKGGDGIVIIRYTDYASAAKEVTPIIDFPLYENVSEQSVDVSASLSMAGGGKTSVALYAVFGYESGDYLYTNLLQQAFAGDAALKVTGLSPSRTYFMRLLADNGLEGGTAVSKEQTFTTLPALRSDCSMTASGTTVTFKGTQNALADGASTVKVLVGESADQMVAAESFTPTELGDFTLVHDFELTDYGKHFYYAIVQENTLGDYSWICSTATNELNITDTAVYTWKGGEGDWHDPEMWTSSTPGVGRGFPVYGSTAKILATETPAVVRSADAERVQSLSLAGNVTFKGTAAGASISFVGSGVSYSFSCDVTFDGMKFLAGSGGLNANCHLRLINGAWMNFDTWNFSLGANSVLEVDSGSFFSCRALLGGGGSTIIVDGGEVRPWSGMMLTYNGGECNAIIRGDGSKFVCNGDNLSEKATFNLTFEIPKNGYTEPPVIGKLSGTKGCVVKVPRSAPIHKATSKLPVQLTTDNVTASLVTFGDVDNKKSRFFYSNTGADDGNKLWYFHAAPPGLVVIFR